MRPTCPLRPIDSVLIPQTFDAPDKSLYIAVSDTSTPSPFGTPAPKIIFQKISLSLVFSLVVINLLLVQNSVRAPVKQGRGRGGRFYVLRWWYCRSNSANCYYIISSWKIIRVILVLFLIGVAGRPKLLRDNPHLFKSPTDRAWTGRLLSYAA